MLFNITGMAAILACAATASFAAPITQNFSASVMLHGTFGAGFSTAHESGFTRDNFTSPNLPSPFANYQAVVNTDNTQPPGNTLSGTFNQCAANGIDCVAGELSSFNFVGSFGALFKNTVNSSITSGTGIYAGASGGWSNELYAPNIGIGDPNDYALFNFAKGSITLADGTSHQLQNSAVVLGIISPNPEATFVRNDETAAALRFGDENVLPITLIDYQADVTFGPIGATGGDVRWCSADGLNCLFGAISDFQSAPGVGDFYSHVPSKTTIVSGTGIYAGATGFWNNDVYAVNSFDDLGNVTGYTLGAFFDGQVTFGVPEPSTGAAMIIGLFFLATNSRKTKQFNGNR